MLQVAQHHVVAAFDAAAEKAPAARETHTIPEACARIGIGKTLGYELARDGRFPVPIIKAGRRLLVSRAAVDRLLAEGSEAVQ